MIMQTIKRLNEIQLNKKCRISDISDNDQNKIRYYEIGLTPDSTIELIFESPLKNPKAYFVNGYVIVIRNEDARNIKVIID